MNTKSLFTSDNLKYLEEIVKNSTPGVWNLKEDCDISSVWVVAENLPVALFDYSDYDQNLNDAKFLIAAKANFVHLLNEVDFLRSRVTELIEANNKEVARRIAIQNELNEKNS